MQSFLCVCMHTCPCTHMYAYKYLCIHWLLWAFLFPPPPPPLKVSTFVCLTFETKGILRDLLCSDELLFIAHAFPEFEEQAKKECLRQGVTQCPKHYHSFPGTIIKRHVDLSFMDNLSCRNCADFYWVLYCKPVSSHFCITQWLLI